MRHGRNDRYRAAVGICVAFGLGVLGSARGGNLDSPATPTDPGSAMHTLEDIYNRLESGAAGTPSAFVEPLVGPGSTGHTLDQVMSQAPATNANAATAGEVLSGKVFWGLGTGAAWGTNTGTATVSASLAPVARTGAGNISGYTLVTGEDGHASMRKGVAWPNPRFTDNANGTVTDNLTGLIWLKDANAFGACSWATALTNCVTLSTGEHGLTDGSADGDWRLPNMKELLSLVDYNYANPPLCNTIGTGQWTPGDPFTGVVSSSSSYYWLSTTFVLSADYAWCVFLDYLTMNPNIKTSTQLVWPVRGGQ